jgi:hypothetical protein
MGARLCRRRCEICIWSGRFRHGFGTSDDYRTPPVHFRGVVSFCYVALEPGERAATDLSPPCAHAFETFIHSQRVASGWHPGAAFMEFHARRQRCRLSAFRPPATWRGAGPVVAAGPSLQEGHHTHIHTRRFLLWSLVRAAAGEGHTKRAGQDRPVRGVQEGFGATP